MFQHRLGSVAAKTIANSLLCLSALAAGVAAAAEKNQADQANVEKPKFIRAVRNEKGVPIALETAIARYQSENGAVVDLIGVVHVADQAYYEKLNQIFEDYESVLYELVAPSEKRPKPGQRGGAVSGVQSGMTGLLELSFQLDHIDYHKENFVHADMSPKEFAKSMTDRGESVWQVVFRSIGYSAARQGKGGSNDFAMLQAFLSNNRAQLLKREMAQQFEDLDGLDIFEGPDGSSTLITERNRKAFEVLKEQLDAGKKKLAVFYGAGHLLDMDRRLREDFQMKPVNITWMRAWKIE